MNQSSELYQVVYEPPLTRRRDELLMQQLGLAALLHDTNDPASPSLSLVAKARKEEEGSPSRSQQEYLAGYINDFRQYLCKPLPLSGYGKTIKKLMSAYDYINHSELNLTLLLFVQANFKGFKEYQHRVAHARRCLTLLQETLHKFRSSGRMGTTWVSQTSIHINPGLLPQAPELHELYLPQSDFRHAYLRTSLNGSDLSNSCFRCTNASTSSFQGTTLTRATFDRAELLQCNFSDANLTAARLIGVYAKEANFTQVDLMGATLYHAQCPHANFQRARLIGTKLERSDFFSGDFTGAEISGADLVHSDFRQANMTGADLHCAYIRSSLLVNTNLNGANLKGAHLSMSDFSRADLRNANLYEARIEPNNSFLNAHYNQATQFPEHFDPVAQDMKEVNE